MSEIKNGDWVVTPEGNIGIVTCLNYHADSAGNTISSIILNNGKGEDWRTSALKPHHKEKRPFTRGEEVWVMATIAQDELDIDGDVMFYIGTSRDIYSHGWARPSQVFRKEGIPND